MLSDALDPEYRPTTYWNPADVAIANIVGDVRKACVLDALEEGHPERLPSVFYAERLPDEAVRENVRRGGPGLRGGECLPLFLDDEVEIARLTFDAALREVITIRAWRDDGAIHYRIVADPDQPLCWPIETSENPLTLGELTRGLMKLRSRDEEEPYVLDWWGSHADREGREGLAILNVKAVSVPYPMLHSWYQELACYWAVEVNLSRYLSPVDGSGVAQSGTALSLHSAAARGAADRIEELVREGSVDLDAVLGPEVDSNVSGLSGGFGCNQDLAQRILPLLGFWQAHVFAGATPLMLAAANGRSEAVDCLLEAGADPRLADPVGHTAAEIASHFGHADIGEKLSRAALDADLREVERQVNRAVEEE